MGGQKSPSSSKERGRRKNSLKSLPKEGIKEVFEKEEKRATFLVTREGRWGGD